MPPSHRDELLSILRTGASAYVDLDPSFAGVVIPDALRGSAQLTLEYGERLPVPIPDLEVGAEGIAATLSFQRVPARTFVPWGAVSRVRPGSRRGPSCALCGRVRAEVPLLVEGNAGALCSDCVGPALEAFEAQSPPGAIGAQAFAALDAVLAELPPTTRRADSGALLEAACALVRGEPRRVEAIMRRAMALAQPEWALHASAGLPASTRSFDVTKLRAFAHLDRLDAEAALAELDALEPSALGGRAGVELACNRAAACAELAPPDLARLEGALQAADAAIDALGPSADPQFAAGARRALGPVRARARLLAGDVAAARAALPELLGATHARTLALAGEIVASLDGAAAAREVFRRALAHAHGESMLAARLAARLRG